MTGPGTITLGVPGDTVTLPALNAGETVTVDYNPRNPLPLSSTRGSLWPLMGQQRLTALIPPGTTTPVLSATGSNSATTVAIAYTPIAERFW